MNDGARAARLCISRPLFTAEQTSVGAVNCTRCRCMIVRLGGGVLSTEKSYPPWC